MSRTGIFLKLKMIIPDIYDSNRNRRTIIIGETKRRGVNNEEANLICDFVELITKFKIVGDETTEYIFDKNSTMRSVSERFNGYFDETKFKSVLNKIAYDQRKVESMFGKYIIDDIMNGSNIAEYREKITRKKDEIIVKNRVNNVLSIKVRDDVLYSEYDGNFIEDYKEILYYYSYNNQRNIERALYENDRFSGYFNYINSDIESKSETASNDRKMMLEIFNGKYNGIKSSDSIIKSIEEIACKDSIKNAVIELANRVYELEMSVDYNVKDSDVYLKKLVNSGYMKLLNWNGNAVYACDKLLICKLYEKSDVGEVMELGRLLDNENVIIDIDIKRIIADSKKKSIIENVDFDHMSLCINELMICIEHLDIVNKVTNLSKAKGIKLYNRYIVIENGESIVVVMNSNDKDLIEVERIDCK